MTREAEGGPPAPRDFYPLQGMNGLWVAISAALLVLSVAMTILGPSGDSALEVAMGRALFGAVALFAGVSTARVLARVRRGGPTLSFNEDGIIDATGIGPPVFIPWKEIASMRRGPGANPPLEIELRDPSSVKLSWIRRINHRLLGRIRGAHVVLLTGGLDAPSHEVVALAHAWNEQHLLEEVRTEARGKELGEGAGGHRIPGSEGEPGASA